MFTKMKEIITLKRWRRIICFCDAQKAKNMVRNVATLEKKNDFRLKLRNLWRIVGKSVSKTLVPIYQKFIYTQLQKTQLTSF